RSVPSYRRQGRQDDGLLGRLVAQAAPVVAGRFQDRRLSLLAARVVVLHQALFFARPVLVAGGIALVMQLLAAPQPELQLDAPVAVMQVQWNQRIASLFDLADQF